jgi:hypothetical protein
MEAQCNAELGMETSAMKKVTKKKQPQTYWGSSKPHPESVSTDYHWAKRMKGSG